MAAPASGPPTIDTELSNPPTDGISTVRFSHSFPGLLLASSWDTTVRLYDVHSNQIRCSYAHKAPVLDCCFSSSMVSYSGGIDKVVKMCDLSSGTEKILGTHEEAVRCVEYCHEEHFVITGSWDSTVQFWDERSGHNVGTYSQPNKVYTMSTSGHRLVVGTAGRNVNIYDIRSMREPQQRRESSLKNQTRCIRIFPDGQGYALSSIEGRVAIEYFDPSPEIQQKKYAFKCHRIAINGVDTIYPVNALAFHPAYGTFATGGCDGFVAIWDGQNKKRLAQLYQYPTSVASLSFSEDGSMLAVAASYTFEDGEKDHPNDAIFIHKVADHEVKPKSRK